MTLKEFANTICTNNDNIKRPIYIYNDDIDTIPDDDKVNLLEDKTLLLGVYLSDFNIESTFSSKLCNAEIGRIFWTKYGFAVTLISW